MAGAQGRYDDAEKHAQRRTPHQRRVRWAQRVRARRSRQRVRVPWAVQERPSSIFGRPSIGPIVLAPAGRRRAPASRSPASCCARARWRKPPPRPGRRSSTTTRPGLPLSARARSRCSRAPRSAWGTSPALRPATKPCSRARSPAGNERQIAEQHDSLCRVLLQRELYVAAAAPRRREPDRGSDRSRRLTTSSTALCCRPTSCGGWARLDDADRELDAMFSRDSGMGAADGRARAIASARPRAGVAGTQRERARGRDRAARARGDTDRPVTPRCAASCSAWSSWRSPAAGERPRPCRSWRRRAPPRSSRPIGSAIAQAALAKAEVLLRLRRYDEALTAAGPAGRPARRRRAARVRLAGRAAGGRRPRRRSGEPTPRRAGRRWPPPSARSSSRSSMPAGLRRYESRPDLKPWL